MKKYAKLLCIGILSVSLLFTAGCSSKKNAGTYLLSDIEEGYFIKVGDEFYPLIENAVSQSSSTSTTSSDIAKDSISVVWVSEQRDLIPVLGKDCSLCLFMDESLPDIVPVYYLTDYGITLGMSLARTYDENVFALSSNTKRRFCEGSDAQKVLKSSSSDLDSMKIVDIGDTKISSDMLTEVYTIKNLTEDADYNVTYYIGSHYKTVAITADTHVFSAAKGSIKSISDFGYTQKGYVTLNIPENFEKGYYYIDGGGIFYYDPDATGGYFEQTK